MRTEIKNSSNPLEFLMKQRNGFAIREPLFSPFEEFRMDFRVEKRRFDEGNSSAIVEENRLFYANRTSNGATICTLLHKGNKQKRDEVRKGAEITEQRLHFGFGSTICHKPKMASGD